MVSNVIWGLPRWCSTNAGNMGLIPESGRSPRLGNSNRFQYLCLKNSCGTFSDTSELQARPLCPELLRRLGSRKIVFFGTWLGPEQHQGCELHELCPYPDRRPAVGSEQMLSTGHPPQSLWFWYHPLFFMPSILPIIRIISNESTLRIKWPSIGASASGLPMNIQDWFSSLWSPRDSSRIFSSTTVKKHQFFSTQPSLYSNSHIHTWLLEKP